MTLAKRSKNRRAAERWEYDPDKVVSYELTFKGKPIRPGQQFKIKNDRNVYTFHCLVHNIVTDTTWIECTSPEGFHSFRPEKIYKLAGIKKSFIKKVENVD